MPKEAEVSVRYQASSTAECAPLVMYMDLEVASEPAPAELLAKRTHCVQASSLIRTWLLGEMVTYLSRESSLPPVKLASAALQQQHAC